jgi:hypothetical protein
MAKAGDKQPRSEQRRATERVALRQTPAQRARFPAARKASGYATTGQFIDALLSDQPKISVQDQLLIFQGLQDHLSDLRRFLSQIDCRNDDDLHALKDRLLTWPASFARTLDLRLFR